MISPTYFKKPFVIFSFSVASAFAQGADVAPSVDYTNQSQTYNMTLGNLVVGDNGSGGLESWSSATINGGLLANP